MYSSTSSCPFLQEDSKCDTFEEERPHRPSHPDTFSAGLRHFGIESKLTERKTEISDPGSKVNAKKVNKNDDPTRDAMQIIMLSGFSKKHHPSVSADSGRASGKCPTPRSEKDDVSEEVSPWPLGTSVFRAENPHPNRRNLRHALQSVRHGSRQYHQDSEARPMR